MTICQFAKNSLKLDLVELRCRRDMCPRWDWKKLKLFVLHDSK